MLMQIYEKIVIPKNVAKIGIYFYGFKMEHALFSYSIIQLFFEGYADSSQSSGCNFFVKQGIHVPFTLIV